MSSKLNLCSLPPWIVASWQFNEEPEPLEIQGVLRENRGLFERLEAIEEPEARAQAFHDYLSVRFYLHQWEDEASEPARRALKNSYVRFLRRWGADSNSIEGAVLKGWVESRLGIVPTFHREPIPVAEFDDYTPYAIDRMRGSARTNGINSQLDLLFSFCQYELGRRRPGERWVTLYRGTYDATEHAILERTSRREYVVRLNNLCSFTEDRERAWEFGSTVWRARVPLCKVFFFADLLPQSLLKGEGEYLVIGGEFRVEELAS